MTTKRTRNEPAPVVNKPAQTWRGFVNIELDKAQKETALKLTEVNLDFLRGIENLLEFGYRLSVTFSDAEHVYNATVTGTDRHPTDSGIAVTARSTKVDNAVAGVIVKTLVAAHANLSNLFEGVQYRQTDL